MFSEKYKPTSLHDVLGNQMSIKTLEYSLEKWCPSSKPIILLYGPSGTGKTLSIELLLKNKNYNSLEIATDDERDKEYMKKHVKPFIKTPRNVMGKRNALVVNDVDCSTDYGFLSALVECAKETKIPILCTCNDLYLLALKPLRALSTEIKFNKISWNDSVFKYFHNIIKKENLKTTTMMTADSFHGDMRNALNQLQAGLSFSKDERMNLNIFDATNMLLSQSNDYESKYNAFFLESEMLPLLVHENHIANNIYGLNEIALSADDISDADLFDHENLESVASSLIKATQYCHSKANIKFPSLLGNLSTRSKNMNLYSHWQICRCPITFRLDFLYYILHNLFYPTLENNKSVKIAKHFVQQCFSLSFEREKIVEFELLDSPFVYKNVNTTLKRSITKLFQEREKEKEKETEKGKEIKSK